MSILDADWVCNNCGVLHGNWWDQGRYVGPHPHAATYHIGTCDCCGATQVPVTEPRDYGGLGVLSKANNILVDKVLRDFNFQRVQEMMVAVDWKWITPTSALQVPSVERMRESAKSMLTRLVNDPRNAITATGGLWAEKHEWDPESRHYGGLSLKFVFEESEAWWEEDEE